jgi:ADP-ribose pyrophosphatase
MSVREDAIVLADGSESTFAVVSRADSVLVVCDFADGALLMTRQYRYASRRWSLELPQGGRGPGESAADAALRELREETGWIAAEPQVMAQRLYEAGDWATQSITVVRVRPVRRDTPSPEAGEAGIESLLVPRDRLAGCVRSGELCDAATLAALFLADHLDPATTTKETR